MAKTLAPMPRRPAISSAIAETAFAELRVSAALHVAPTARTYGEWYPLSEVPNVMQSEYDREVAHRRFRYNERCLTQARRGRSAGLGEHAGFADFFVPVGDVEGAWGTLVVGPFSTARPTSGDVLSRWRSLTGGHGRLGDPAFAHYLATTLSTLTVEGPLLDDFRRFLTSLSRLLGDVGSAEEIAAEIATTRPRLRALRAAERMWEAARTMVDERTTLRATADVKGLARLGLRRVPQHAVVGLLLGFEREADPVEHAIRRDAFQRACVDFALRRGGVICTWASAYRAAPPLRRYAIRPRCPRRRRRCPRGWPSSTRSPLRAPGPARSARSAVSSDRPLWRIRVSCPPGFSTTSRQRPRIAAIGSSPRAPISMRRRGQ